MRAAIYCRVSSKSQDDALQLHDLEALCLRSGWTVVSVFRDKISGLTASNDRAALRELLVCARQRKFDKVVVWSVDRLGRSMPQLISTLTELNACGVHLVSFRQGIDTSTPMGSMLWQFLGIFAEFEHSIRKERQSAGIARAKEKGVKFGRPTISFSKASRHPRDEIARSGHQQNSRQAKGGFWHSRKDDSRGAAVGRDG